MSVWLQPASADEWWAVERPRRDRKRALGLNATVILTYHIRFFFIEMKGYYIAFCDTGFRQILQLSFDVIFILKEFISEMYVQSKS